MSEKTITASTWRSHHRGGAHDPQTFETIGLHVCDWGGVRRLRRLWRLSSGANDLAYWRNADGWMVPVCKLSEVVA